MNIFIFIRTAEVYILEQQLIDYFLEEFPKTVSDHFWKIVLNNLMAIWNT